MMDEYLIGCNPGKDVTLFTVGCNSYNSSLHKSREMRVGLVTHSDLTSTYFIIIGVYLITRCLAPSAVLMILGVYLRCRLRVQ